MTKYKNFVINFHEGQKATLNYKSEIDGLAKYETSFLSPHSLKEGEYVKLTLTVEYALINEKNKTIQ